MTDRFTYIDEDFEVMLKEIGTKASGHHGHKGIPGHRGGSAPSGESLGRYWPRSTFTGKPYENSSEPSLETQALIEKGLRAVNKVIGKDFGEGQKYWVGELYTRKDGSGPLGQTTSLFVDQKDTHEDIICISEKRIRASYEKYKGDPSYMMKWHGMSEWSFEALFQDVVTHEMGHVWWNSVSQKSTELFEKKVKGGVVRVRREENPVLVEWAEKIWPKYHGHFPLYGNYYTSYTEGFADEFAAYVNGEDMEPDVEDWFRRNVK